MIEEHLLQRFQADICPPMKLEVIDCGVNDIKLARTYVSKRRQKIKNKRLNDWIRKQHGIVVVDVWSLIK